MAPLSAFNSSFMPDPERSVSVGPYVLTRPLGASVVGARFLALHETQQTSHVAYRLDAYASRADRTRLESTYELLSQGLRHPHILRLEELRFEAPIEDGSVEANEILNGNGTGGEVPWIITPFAGDADGLRPLSKLLRQKGGQIHQIEAELAITQILSGLAHAHDPLRKVPLYHGPLMLDEIIVDRHGRIVLEMLGFGRRMKGMLHGNSETVRDEIVRVCEIAYQLLTGLRAEEPLIPATRLVPRLNRAWDQWLRVGLDPSRGFESARQALEMLPSANETLSVTVPSRRELPVRG